VLLSPSIHRSNTRAVKAEHHPTAFLYLTLSYAEPAGSGVNRSVLLALLFTLTARSSLLRATQLIPVAQLPAQVPTLGTHSLCSQTERFWSMSGQRSAHPDIVGSWYIYASEANFISLFLTQKSCGVAYIPGEGRQAVSKPMFPTNKCNAVNKITIVVGPPLTPVMS
jgi:hypothetical protein